MKQKYQRFSFPQLWPQRQQESPAAQGAAAAAAAVGALLGCQTEAQIHKSHKKKTSNLEKSRSRNQRRLLIRMVGTPSNKQTCSKVDCNDDDYGNDLLPSMMGIYSP